MLFANDEQREPKLEEIRKDRELREKAEQHFEMLAGLAILIIGSCFVISVIAITIALIKWALR